MNIPKVIRYGDKARTLIKQGLDTLANAVKVTLGPRGRNVIFNNKFLPPTITKDGVTVARQIDLNDPFENQGCAMGKEVAGRTVEMAGDGTSSAVVLTQAIFNEGLIALSSGVNPILLSRGMEKAGKAIDNILEEVAIPIAGSQKDILNVATISANNEKELGEIITKAVNKVGEDGVITIEESPSAETYLEIVKGMQLTEGLQSPWFINDPQRLRTVYKKPAILIIAKELNNPHEIIPIFTKCIEAHKPLIVMAEKVSGQALSTLILNYRQKGAQVAAVKAPGYGERRHQFMDDISIYTGTQVVAEETGIDITKLEISDLGQCEKIEITKESCTIIGGKGVAKSVNARIEEIKIELSMCESDYDKEKLQERLAKLTTGVAVIKVGAQTDTVMKEKKMRVEDALHATKAAIDEGIVPGGGVALYRVKQRLSEGSKMMQEEIIGWNIIRKVMDLPLRTITSNAGLDGAEVIANIKDKSTEYGLNVLTMKYGNLYKQGVIDPVKVVRVCMKNAISVTGMALTCEVSITEDPDWDKEKNKEYPGR